MVKRWPYGIGAVGVLGLAAALWLNSPDRPFSPAPHTRVWLTTAAIKQVRITANTPDATTEHPRWPLVVKPEIREWLSRSRSAPHAPRVSWPHDFLVMDYFGPSVLDLRTSQGNFAIYPDYRVVRTGKSGYRLQYAPPYIVIQRKAAARPAGVVPGRLQHIQIVRNPRLYQWLRGGQWRLGFSPDA